MDNFINSFFADTYKYSNQNKLDRLYMTNKSEYEAFKNELKAQGYKVFRNSDGKHKVVRK